MPKALDLSKLTEWKRQQIEARRARNRVHYQKYREHQRQYSKKYRSRPEVYARMQQRDKHRRNDPVQRLHIAKQDAWSRSLSFNVNDTTFIILLCQPCHYCGFFNPERLLGVDRVDSSKGYEENNCVSCCPPCNNMKNTIPEDQFIDQCRKIAERHPPNPPVLIQN